MKRAACILLLTLGACTTGPQPEFDRIYLPTFHRTKVQVEFVEYDRWEDMQAAYWATTGNTTNHVQAWTQWSGNSCKIHAVKITEQNWWMQMINRGHEVMHCTHGNYHNYKTGVSNYERY